MPTPLLLLAALAACSQPDAPAAWVMLDAEARTSGVTVLVDEQHESAPALPLAVEVGAELVILTDHEEHRYTPRLGEVMWIRGVEAWVDPVYPVASNQLRVSGEHDANEELAEWLGGELVDDLIVGNDVWGAAAAEEELPYGVDEVEPRVADAEASLVDEGPKTLTEEATETFSLSFSATIEGTLTRGSPELDLPQLGPELVAGVPSDPRAPLLGLYGAPSGDCLLLDPSGSWSLCRQDFEVRGTWRRQGSRLELLQADDTRPWHWDGRDLRDPSGTTFALETL